MEGDPLEPPRRRQGVGGVDEGVIQTSPLTSLMPMLEGDFDGRVAGVVGWSVMVASTAQR